MTTERRDAYRGIQQRLILEYERGVARGDNSLEIHFRLDFVIGYVHAFANPS